MTGRRGHPAGR